MAEEDAIMQFVEPIVAELTHEAATTRRLLARIPDERLSWRPHARSMTLGSLAAHLVAIPALGVRVVNTTELVLDPAAFPTPEATGVEAVLAAFEANVTALKDALHTTSYRDLLKPWRLLSGTRVVLELPRVGAVRSLVLNHLIHHRGQLSVFLRLLEVPLPSIYGPTADESI